MFEVELGENEKTLGFTLLKNAHPLIINEVHHYLENRFRITSLGVDFCYHFIKNNAIKIDVLSYSHDGP